MFNFIKLYIDRMTKEDIKSFISKNNYDVSNSEIDIIYFYIKNYNEEFFNDPVFVLNKIKKDITPNTYSIILELYHRYRKYI